MPLLCGYDHARGADDALAETVAGLVDLDDRSARGAAFGRLWHGRDRLVQRRIERLAARRERLDTDSRERAGQLGEHEPHAAEQRGLVGLAGRDGDLDDRAFEVVDRRQKLLRELGDTALLRERRLARDALAVVLEVSLRALREREVLVALGRERAELAVCPGWGIEVALQLGRAVDVLSCAAWRRAATRRRCDPRRGRAGGLRLAGVLVAG